MKQVKKLISLILTSVFCIAVIVASINVSAKEGDVKTIASKVQNLNLVAEGCNVHFDISPSGQIEYDYDKSKFDVTSSVSDSTTTIAAKKKSGVGSVGLMDMISIRIPNKTYNTITVDSTKAGITLPEMNVNFNVTSKGGSLSIPVPMNYNKTFNYTSVSGAGSIIFKKNAKNFKVFVKNNSSAVSIPKNWTSYTPRSSYQYTSGNGAGVFVIDVSKSAFSINNNAK